MFKIKDLEIINNGMIERFNLLCLAPAIGAYKHVVVKKLSAIVYEVEVSGLLSLDRHGNFVEGNCREQATVIIKNLHEVIINVANHYQIDLLDRNPLDYITSSLVALNTMQDFPLVNSAYEDNGMPATCRVAFAVKELPLTAKGALVEIRANFLLPININVD